MVEQEDLNDNLWQTDSENSEYSLELMQEGRPNIVPNVENEDLMCDICYEEIGYCESAKECPNKCASCKTVSCNECLTDWASESIKKLYVQDAHNMPLLQVKCTSEGCKRSPYTMAQFQIMLTPQWYEKVCRAMTIKMLQSCDDEFVSCPNKNCESFGFPLDGIEAPYYACSNAFQCAECNYTWQTSGQINANCFSLSTWLPNLTELHSVISVYKLLCGEPCPRCKVMIIRTGGCKFMKCEKCQYEFCWYCLDEFYTEYHYYYTDCPFRYCLFHSLEVLMGVLILLKIISVSVIVKSLFFWIISVAQFSTYGLLLMFMSVKSLINKQKQHKNAQKLKENSEHRNLAFRNQDRALIRRIQKLHRKVEKYRKKSKSQIIFSVSLTLVGWKYQDLISLNFYAALVVALLGSAIWLYDIQTKKVQARQRRQNN